MLVFPMDNEQLMGKLRTTLSINDDEMAEIFRLSGYEPEQVDLNGSSRDNEAASSSPGSDRTLSYFLEGLILRERGPRPDGAPVAVHSAFK